MTTIIQYVGIYAAVVFGISGLVRLITKKLGKNISLYLIFGIVDIFCALMITAVALYDILTPGGDLNGLFGTVLLIVFIPVSVVLLIGDVVLWHSNRRRSQETDSR